MKKTQHLFALLALISLPLRPAFGDTINLRFSHFWPSSAGEHEGFKAWAKSLSDASNGRINVEIYPAQTLTKAPQSYDAVKNRIADITATVQGYTANRFPLTQIIELPGIAGSATEGSCIIQTLYDEGLISNEYEDTHVLFLFTHSPGHLHTREKAIVSPKDLAGLKIRRPTTVVAEMLENLGAQPVGMPAPEIYTSLQRGVTDGLAMPWEGIKGFRLNELVRHHTELDLYNLSFVVTMNSSTYNSLPEDLKKVVDQHSGIEWAIKQGEIFENLEEAGRKEALEAGHQIIKLENVAQNADWKPVLDGVTENYISELETRGLPSRKVLNRAKELSGKCKG